MVVLPDLPTELITHMLRGNVGPHAFGRARQVSRSWAGACEDALLIEALAAYVDGLTRTCFRGILRLTAAQARLYPHRSHRVRTSHGVKECFLYSAMTVKRALRELGGLEGLRSRAPFVVVQRAPSFDEAPRRSRAEIDERLHARKVASVEAAFLRTHTKRYPMLSHAQLQAAWRRRRESLREDHWIV